MSFLNSFIFDLIFPTRCLKCDDFSDRYVCKACKNSFKFNYRNYCIFCDEIASYGQICLSCDKKHSLDFCLSASSYKNPLARKMISVLKYRFIKDMSHDINYFLINFLSILGKRGLLDINKEEAVVIAVPLHPKRLRWRSFNQAQLLAKGIAKHFKIRNYKDILTKKYHKIPQVKLISKKERVDNIQDSFHCKKTKRIAGKTILLIDDVVTTGSTLDECAKVL